MKKILAGLTLFLTGSLITFAATMTFTDVKEGDWFAKGVKYSSEHELMTGYDEKTFGPNDPVNRAQLATVLERMNAGDIDEMYIELLAIRQQDKIQLQGSSWKEYIAASDRFPVGGVQGKIGVFYNSYEHESVKDEFKVLASDKRFAYMAASPYELMSADPTVSEELGTFFIRFDSVGGGTFGPFHDDIGRLISEIEALNAETENQ